MKIERSYAPLKAGPSKAPRIFTAPEQARIFDALATDPQLELGRIAFTLSRNTLVSVGALRRLRLQSLELEAAPPRIHIPAGGMKKNTRPRIIPLNAPALGACHDALARANRLGCHDPDDYLFPLQVRRSTCDPKRPAPRFWLRKQLERLRLVTGIDHITPHAFRHTAITELLEGGVPEETVIAIAGWLGRLDA
jgi:integrase